MIMVRILADILRQLQRSHLGAVHVIGIGSQRGVQRVRLLQAMAVTDDRVVHHLQGVPWRPDHPLYDVQVWRRIFHRPEYHNFVPVRRCEGRQTATMDAGQRDLELAPEHCFVDEQEITDEERVFHARRGNAEGFDEKGPQHDPNQQRRADRLEPCDRFLLSRLRTYVRLDGLRRGWRGSGLWCRLGRSHGLSIQSAMKMFVSP